MHKNDSVCLSLFVVDGRNKQPHPKTPATQKGRHDSDPRPKPRRQTVKSLRCRETKQKVGMLRHTHRVFIQVQCAKPQRMPKG